ncbi:MAG: hypothetical protein V3V49_05305 [Candidatus Krumholzibacteria bacterium]
MTAVATILVVVNLVVALGAPVWIDFGETIIVTQGSGRYAYEEEIDGTSTALGLAVTVLSIMLGARAGMAVHARRLDGGLSAKSRIDFRACFFGVAAYGFIGTLLYAAIGEKDGILIVLHNLLQLGALVLIFVLFKRWRDRKHRGGDMKPAGVDGNGARRGPRSARTVKWATRDNNRFSHLPPDF